VMCGKVLSVPWLYARVSLYVVVSSAHGAEGSVFWVFQSVRGGSKP
jgi:hypothetical protein